MSRLPSLTANQWKVLLGVTSAVVAYLLIQTDVPLSPIAKVALGAVAVACAVLKTGEPAPKA